MAGGLVALLDDIAVLAKLAAASLDDVGTAAARAGTKAAGVVIDDTAVTPRYVVGLSPERELPIIAKIALGSVRNKLLYLLPAALGLSALAPWAITPLLMAGGAYLCFEASEKILAAIGGGDHADDVTQIGDPVELERRQVGGAIRTDFILSAEIMAITLGTLTRQSLLAQGIILALVGLAITVGVYGVVAVIVKMDDIGLHLARRSAATVRAVGRGLVAAMPLLLRALSIIGTAAMAWVGGGIIAHGLEVFGLIGTAHLIERAADAARATPIAAPLFAWLAGAAVSAIIGLGIGAAIVALLHLRPRALT